MSPGKTELKLPVIGYESGDTGFLFQVNRNMSVKEDYIIDPSSPDEPVRITVFKPDTLSEFEGQLRNESAEAGADLSDTDLNSALSRSLKKITLTFNSQTDMENSFTVSSAGTDQVEINIHRGRFSEGDTQALLNHLHKYVELRGVTLKDLSESVKELDVKPFFLLFLITVILVSLLILRINTRISTLFPVGAIVVLWLIPGIGLLGRIICSIIYFSTLSLLIIDKEDIGRFSDHAKFLLMILLYSGFWVLYFQMFDSVLWYVQAYVDASSLNLAVNKFLGLFGISINWFFDVEHVTVINAGVIILLQLMISNIVKNRKALPTMMTGIGIATIGMGILAVSTDIWIFITGIVLFSIGEMTAHPKFISYIGITAPPDKKAMYMGYLFLYGVFGSSVGGIVGAKLYVHFVDNLNQPRTLWLIFAGIGVLTIVSLLLYNRFFVKKSSK